MSEKAAQRRIWTKERIEARLASEKFDYQKVLLPFGLSTPGHDRSSTAALIFPQNMNGKTILDVGASLGFFCFEAERRGASSTVGIEVDPRSVEQARVLGDMQGSSAEFICGDLESALPDRVFDYVLCLNVLHHLHDPIGALNKLIDRTKETLVLEVATFGSHDKKKVRLPAFICSLIAKLPIIFVTAAGTRGGREIQRFYISEPAIRNFLTVHRGVFASIEIKKSEHKGRFVVLAHKRRIKHLLIVAGPTSAGKKTVERHLIANELPEISRLLGEPDGNVWAPILNANHIDQPDTPERRNVLLHYDIMRPLMRSTRVYERDEAMELISCAERVSFLTVLAPVERLRQQIETAEIAPRRASRKHGKARHLRILDFYANQENVDEVYRAWIAFTAKHSDEHWLIESNRPGEYTVQEAAEWQAKPVSSLYR